jgi:hypothetical protein
VIEGPRRIPDELNYRKKHKKGEKKPNVFGKSAGKKNGL